MAFKRGVQSDGSWRAYAGDRNRVPWRFTADGALRDLTGCTISAQVRVKDTDLAVAITARVEMTDPAAGVVHISWDGEEVRALLAGQPTWKGVYDVQVLEAGQALPDTVHRGDWYAQMDVTREEVQP